MGLCNDYDWSVIENMPFPDSKTDKFHEIVEIFKNECFPTYLQKRRDDEDPWMSEALKAMSKKTKVIFRKKGRGEEWKEAVKILESRVRESIRAYHDREVEKITSGKNNKGMVYTALKKT